MTELNQKEEKALNEFRCRVADILPEDKVANDGFLLRWLIARDFHVEKATSMLHNYLKWYKDNNIENIMEWEAPDDVTAACPYDVSGTDNEGRPVLVFPYGLWTPWDFTDTGRKNDYIKYMNQMLEKCVAAIKPPATQFVIVADSFGFSLRHMTRFKAIEANLEALRGFESHYPEYMMSAFVIKAPRIFSALFALIKPLMSSRTQSKLHVCDSNARRWKELLADHIPQGQLPEPYRFEKDDTNSSVKPSMVDLDFSRQYVDVA